MKGGGESAFWGLPSLSGGLPPGGLPTEGGLPSEGEVCPLRGVCIKADPPPIPDRPTGGLHASYWNAILFVKKMQLHFINELTFQNVKRGIRQLYLCYIGKEDFFCAGLIGKRCPNK